jgi:hypothetical protein
VTTIDGSQMTTRCNINTAHLLLLYRSKFYIASLTDMHTLPSVLLQLLSRCTCRNTCQVHSIFSLSPPEQPLTYVHASAVVNAVCRKAWLELCRPETAQPLTSYAGMPQRAAGFPANCSEQGS